MKKYFTDIFTTYRLWFIFTSVINVYTSLNFLCFALFGVIFPTDIGFGQVMAQVLVWFITATIIASALEDNSHKNEKKYRDITVGSLHHCMCGDTRFCQKLVDKTTRK